MTHTRMGRAVMVGWLAVMAWSGSLEPGAGVAGADAVVRKVECDKGHTLTSTRGLSSNGPVMESFP